MASTADADTDAGKDGSNGGFINALHRNYSLVKSAAVKDNETVESKVQLSIGLCSSLFTATPTGCAFEDDG